MAKYAHKETPEEEYIDLVPILKNLFFDAPAFLMPIKGYAAFSVKDNTDMIFLRKKAFGD